MANIDIEETVAPGGQSTPHPDSLGWLDGYELVRELGGGGFGSVYLVRDPKASVEYAVKGLPPAVRQSKEELENVLKNFRLVQSLTHPHIASLRCVIYPKNVNYFHAEDRDKLRVGAGDPLVVMSYAPGMTLSKWRQGQPGGRVAPEKAAVIVGQVASALDYAHAQQVVHRDIKPSNVMIEERTADSVNCQVLDFGLAAEIRTTLGRLSREVRDVCGTRPYMAPEQWSGSRQGPATDQYALAVLYVELVTGEVPFQSAFDTGDVEVMKSAVLTRRPDLSKVPKSARAAVARALAKKGSARFPSCEAFARALRPRKGRAWIAAALVALAMVAIGVGAFGRKEKTSPQPVDSRATPVVVVTNAPSVIKPKPKPVPLPQPKPTSWKGFDADEMEKLARCKERIKDQRNELPKLDDFIPTNAVERVKARILAVEEQIERAEDANRSRSMKEAFKALKKSEELILELQDYISKQLE